MPPNSVQIIEDQNYFLSIGFAAILGCELKVNKANIGIDDCYILYQYIHDYLKSSQTSASLQLVPLATLTMQLVN